MNRDSAVGSVIVSCVNFYIFCIVLENSQQQNDPMNGSIPKYLSPLILAIILQPNHIPLSIDTSRCHVSLQLI